MGTAEPARCPPGNFKSMESGGSVAAKLELKGGPRSGGFRSPSGAGAACGERQVAGRMGPSKPLVFHPLATRCCHRMRQGARGRPAVPYSYKELNHCKHISSAGWPHPGGWWLSLTHGTPAPGSWLGSRTLTSGCPASPGHWEHWGPPQTGPKQPVSTLFWLPRYRPASGRPVCGSGWTRLAKSFPQVVSASL